MNNSEAPGQPGIPARWTSSAKQGIGTAYCSTSRLWFTISHGILNEIYYPHVDCPNTRDLQFLITDGESFCHEEKRDLEHHCERPEPDALLYRLTNRDPEGRYEIVKEVITDPDSSVLLISTELRVHDQFLDGKLRLFVLLAPHVRDAGAGNSACLADVANMHLLHAERENVHLMLGCSTDFCNRSVGYVGESDGWRDLMSNFQLDTIYGRAENGNTALTGQVNLAKGRRFTIGVSLAHHPHAASTALLQAFAQPFEGQRSPFISQWKQVMRDQHHRSVDDQHCDLFRFSKQILFAHQDKTFPGAGVASLSIPWGEIKGDDDRGGYHMVWTRDLLHTATGLLASGEVEVPLKALVWLACVQHPDGAMPQNSSVDGQPFWQGEQLDEVAAPVLLAWRLRRTEALQCFDPQVLVWRSVRYLILNGPVTQQDRWEKASGYSPSTLAAIIAAIVCAADFARDAEDPSTAVFLLEYADALVASLKRWTATDCGELMEDHPRHFVRITPALANAGPNDPDPNSAIITIANGGGEYPARNVIDAGFLQLVRYGILAADDPLVTDSLAVVDEVLRRELPQGPCWRRFNHDGYGEHADGAPYDGNGEGHSWPLLTGERGHYELAAGGDPQPYLRAMEGFATDQGLLAEQLWDAEDIPSRNLFLGKPAGSAMPLCWAHAEYLSLVRSHNDGKVFDRIEPVYQRYAKRGEQSHLEIWTFRHQPASIPRNKRLRIICEAAAVVRWTTDDWNTIEESRLSGPQLDLYLVDLPVDRLTSGSEIKFTFHWDEANQWEQQNFVIRVRDDDEPNG